jgi:hypothetical protein
MDLEKYFGKFRQNIIGIDQVFTTPSGEKKLVYGDWIASGRLYGPIEKPSGRLWATPILKPAKPAS